jgi:hypothetical protein
MRYFIWLKGRYQSLALMVALVAQLAGMGCQSFQSRNSPPPEPPSPQNETRDEVIGEMLYVIYYVLQIMAGR